MPSNDLNASSFSLYHGYCIRTCYSTYNNYTAHSQEIISVSFTLPTQPLRPLPWLGLDETLSGYIKTFSTAYTDAQRCTGPSQWLVPTSNPKFNANYLWHHKHLILSYMPSTAPPKSCQVSNQSLVHELYQASLMPWSSCAKVRHCDANFECQVFMLEGPSPVHSIYQS